MQRSSFVNPDVLCRPLQLSGNEEAAAKSQIRQVVPQDDISIFEDKLYRKAAKRLSA